MYPDEEVRSVLLFCYELACGGHFGPRKTAEKCYKVGFTGPHYLKMPLISARHALDAKWSVGF